ncbi:Hypothetical predicted protein [Mytilus galloprovincialis]|uniref:C2H2-type domain-containing protein n=1 Tax=Mytilus galloprovincialis TaxID=29158 RepID=A0A8B6H954_MYTGA|nr:Hypothetical predicted protein [Mytilus galloprovincialis]
MSSTTTYQQMEPYSFGYQRVSIDKRYDKPPVIYRGPDVVENFISHLLEEEKEIRDILSRIEPMIITEYDKLDYKYAKKCYVCKKAFSSKNYKVKEHDHVTGSIRGISCNNYANNLYGWSMSQCLPYGHFNWLTEEEKIKLDITKLKADGSDGYIFEVDLEYPTSLHSSHSDFPLAPERKHIQVEHLSPYSKELLQNLTGKQCLTKIEKTRS